MHKYQTQLRIVFSTALIVVALLATGRSARVVEAQATGCGSNGVGFKLAREYSVGRNNSIVASGDFNQDNVPDLAIAHQGDTSGRRLAILLGDGQGAFARFTGLPLDELVKDLLVGDFNADGKMDLVVAGITVTAPNTSPGDLGYGVGIALGLGDGSFSEWKSYAAGRLGAAVASADFNGDGKLDVAVADRSGGDLVIVTGVGNGTFNAPVMYKSGAGTSPQPGAVVAADFNQDNKPDVIVANQNERSLSVFLNDGQGRFGTPRNITVSDCLALLAGDFSGDGQPDLMVGGVSIMIFLRGDGAGGFATPTNLPLGGLGLNPSVPTSLHKADYNGDGKLDVAFPSGQGITLWLADGVGGYTAQSYAVGRFAVAMTVNDFNRDGKPDFAATKQEATDFAVLLNSGAGDFRAMKTARLSFGLGSVRTADLNKDAKPDLIVMEGSGIYTGLGNGAGEFSEVKTYNSAHRITTPIVASVTADFTGDGNVDLAVLNTDTTDFASSAVTLIPDVGLPAVNPNRIRTFKVGARSADLVAADFNRDNRPDLAVANAGADDVTILLNDGRGGFLTMAAIGVGLEPRSLVASDFNGDNNTDLVVACRNSAGIFLLLGDGRGNFSARGVGIGANPRAVATGDFNRDGKPDLAVPHNNSMFISILLGTGQGSFNPPVVLDIGGRPAALAVGDFTGDGNADLAVTRYFQSFSSVIAEDRVWLFAGDGTGQFVRATDWFVPGASSLHATDFNNDGLLDLAIAATPSSVGGHSVWLAFNACTPPPNPNAAATVNAASYVGVAAAPNAIASVFGTELSNSTMSAPNQPLPNKLGDTEVMVKDSKGVERSAPLFFVSPLQVNYLIPAATSNGIATITVRNGTTKTATGTILILPTAPGLFTANANGEGVPAAKVFRIKLPSNAESYEDVAQFDPVQKKFVPREIDLGFGLFPGTDKVYLLLFGTGLRGRSSLANVRARIGNTDVPVEFVEYAGAQPEYAGLDQVNILISNFRGAGETDLVLTVDGKVTNAVRIKIK
ncbi:MAG TPA: FG-GAP-like repeat-containing protein [Blastocatellia bacterium]|nr:FG-GAP-like repeat-containing protein [Blastocatellia bacterium]